MRRLVTIVTAISFGLAAPVFAQTGPVTGSSGQGSQQASQNGQRTEPLLVDGQGAMAQQQQTDCAPGDTTCGFWNSNGVWVVVGVAGAIGGIIWAISRNQSKSVSP